MVVTTCGDCCRRGLRCARPVASSSAAATCKSHADEMNVETMLERRAMHSLIHYTFPARIDAWKARQQVVKTLPKTPSTLPYQAVTTRQPCRADCSGNASASASASFLGGGAGQPHVLKSPHKSQSLSVVARQEWRIMYCARTGKHCLDDPFECISETACHDTSYRPAKQHAWVYWLT
jgi:hypothetical protein